MMMAFTCPSSNHTPVTSRLTFVHLQVARAPWRWGECGWGLRTPHRKGGGTGPMTSPLLTSTGTQVRCEWCLVVCLSTCPCQHSCVHTTQADLCLFAFILHQSLLVTQTTVTVTEIRHIVISCLITSHCSFFSPFNRLTNISKTGVAVIKQ